MSVVIYAENFIRPVSYGILAHCKSADEFVRLSLVKSFCLPLLCYYLLALEQSSQ